MYTYTVLECIIKNTVVRHFIHLYNMKLNEWSMHCLQASWYYKMKYRMPNLVNWQLQMYRLSI